MSAGLFDSSAILALLRKEKGEDIIREQLKHPAFISVVNYTEILYKLQQYKEDLNWKQVVEIVDDFAFEIIPYTEHQAKIAANIHSISRDQGISLADCVCLACGIDLKLPVFTTDKVWEKIPFKRNIDIRVVR